jgi:hypothetical protein
MESQLCIIQEVQGVIGDALVVGHSANTEVVLACVEPR